MFVITGATGNTGSRAAEVLLAKGEKVRVVGRTAECLHCCLDEGSDTSLFLTCSVEVLV
jgi:short-subunit dehydrogenase